MITDRLVMLRRIGDIVLGMGSSIGSKGFWSKASFSEYWLDIVHGSWDIGEVTLRIVELMVFWEQVCDGRSSGNSAGCWKLAEIGLNWFKFESTCRIFLRQSSFNMRS